jgi:hypothetical protein
MGPEGHSGHEESCNEIHKKVTTMVRRIVTLGGGEGGYVGIEEYIRAYEPFVVERILYQAYKIIKHRKVLGKATDIIDTDEFPWIYEWRGSEPHIVTLNDFIKAKVREVRKIGKGRGYPDESDTEIVVPDDTFLDDTYEPIDDPSLYEDDEPSPNPLRARKPSVSVRIESHPYSLSTEYVTYRVQKALPIRTTTPGATIRVLLELCKRTLEIETEMRRGHAHNAVRLFLHHIMSGFFRLRRSTKGDWSQFGRKLQEAGFYIGGIAEEIVPIGSFYTTYHYQFSLNVRKAFVASIAKLVIEELPAYRDLVIDVLTGRIKYKDRPKLSYEFLVELGNAAPKITELYIQEMNSPRIHTPPGGVRVDEPEMIVDMVMAFLAGVNPTPILDVMSSVLEDYHSEASKQFGAGSAEYNRVMGNAKVGIIKSIVEGTEHIVFYKDKDGVRSVGTIMFKNPTELARRIAEYVVAYGKENSIIATLTSSKREAGAKVKRDPVVLPIWDLMKNKGYHDYARNRHAAKVFWQRLSERLGF